MTHLSFPTIERGRHDKAGRRVCLVEAATQVFAVKGYDAATTREVAGRAGCSEGLIHRYFGGKHGLLLAALEHRAEHVAESFREGAPDRDDLHDEVRGILLWALAHALEQRDFMRVASSRGVIDAEVGRFIGAHLNDERVRAIAGKLARHRDAGRIRADADIEAAAQLIAGFGYQSGFFLQVVFEMEHEEVRRIAGEVSHIIVRGIASAPAGALAGAPRSGDHGAVTGERI